MATLQFSVRLEFLGSFPQTFWDQEPLKTNKKKTSRTISLPNIPQKTIVLLQQFPSRWPCLDPEPDCTDPCGSATLLEPDDAAKQPTQIKNGWIQMWVDLILKTHRFQSGRGFGVAQRQRGAIQQIYSQRLLLNVFLPVHLCRCNKHFLYLIPDWLGKKQAGLSDLQETKVLKN